MFSENRNLLIALPVIAAVVAFWFLAVSPKQDQVKQLDQRAGNLQLAVQTQQGTIAAGKSARKDFPRAYHRLIVSGKAVPTEDETASLLVQINRAAGASGISFNSITGGGDESSSADAPASTTGVPASPGGIANQSYTLIFTGSFFEIADFISRMDRLVNPKGDRIASDGRLFTISGFTLAPDGTIPLPALAATLTVTSYQAAAGTSAGAAPATTATPTSSTTTTTPGTTTSPTTPSSGSTTTPSSSVSNQAATTASPTP